MVRGTVNNFKCSSFSPFSICTSEGFLFLSSLCPSSHGAAFERMFTSRCLCAIVRQCSTVSALHCLLECARSPLPAQSQLCTVYLNVLGHHSSTVSALHCLLECARSPLPALSSQFLFAVQFIFKNTINSRKNIPILQGFLRTEKQFHGLYLVPLCIEQLCPCILECRITMGFSWIRSLAYNPSISQNHAHTLRVEPNHVSKVLDSVHSGPRVFFLFIIIHPFLWTEGRLLT